MARSTKVLGNINIKVTPPRQALHSIGKINQGIREYENTTPVKLYIELGRSTKVDDDVDDGDDDDDDVDDDDDDNGDDALPVVVAVRGKAQAFAVIRNVHIYTYKAIDTNIIINAYILQNLNIYIYIYVKKKNNQITVHM